MDSQTLKEENRRFSEENRQLREIFTGVQALVLTLPKSQQSSLAFTNPETQRNQNSLSVSPAKSPILGLSRPPVKRRLFTSTEPVPQPSGPAYDYKEASVRGKARKALPGHPCTSCENYYKAAGIDQKGISKCSKHRSRRPRQKSPKGYWDLEFPSTQELQAKWAASPSPDPKK